MPANVTGAGDPAKTLQLLWRLPPERQARRGPRQGLSIDQIVSAAISVADAEDLDAVTMRRVAQELGVAAMTLYTYVPGKAELLDLMLDFVYSQMERTDIARQPWRARVEAIAADNRTLLSAHPWAAMISTARPPLGPGVLAKYEHELGAFADTNLDDVAMDSALTLVLQFVRIAAINAAEAKASELESTLTDEEWWAANEPLLSLIVNNEKFPLAGRVGSAVGEAHGVAFDAGHAYEFGLARLLDGLAVLIERDVADR